MPKDVIPIDTEFKTWISQIKKQVRGAQIKASIAQGFSVTNLKYMKRFYKFYEPIRHQLGDEFNSNIFIIPCRHHIEIFTRAKSIDEALFFISKTKENGKTWRCV